MVTGTRTAQSVELLTIYKELTKAEGKSKSKSIILELNKNTYKENLKKEMLSKSEIQTF